VAGSADREAPELPNNLLPEVRTVSKYQPNAPSPLYTTSDLLRQARLEQAANELLAADPEGPARAYGYHSEGALQRRPARRVVPAPAPVRPEAADPYRALLNLVGGVPLGARRRLVLRLSARGYTRAQIAARLGLSGSQVTALKQSAGRRLAGLSGEERDGLLSPALALHETYLGEVARRGYVAEKHCPPGQEACRHTGQCDRRWYLYFVEDAPQAPGEG
jgi:hypothetical protein